MYIYYIKNYLNDIRLEYNERKLGVIKTEHRIIQYKYIRHTTYLDSIKQISALKFP